MKKILFLLFIGLSIQVSAQYTFPTKFKNVKNKKQIHIPGTRFYMIPPEGFKLVPGFTRVAMSANFFIGFYEAKNINEWKEKLMHLDNIITDSMNIQFGKYMGQILCYLSPTDSDQTILLTFGEAPFFAASVVAICRENESFLIPKAIKSFESLYYSWDIAPNPMEIAAFTVDENKSTFKYMDCNSGIFSYTINSKRVEKWPDEKDPMFNIGSFGTDSTVSLKALVDLQVFTMGNNGLKVYSEDLISDKKINGYEAREVEMKAFMDGQKFVIYCIFLRNKEDILLLTGYIPNDYENTLAEMKKLAYAVRFK